jgi:hypothetical protein
VWPVLLGQHWRPRWYITVCAGGDIKWSVNALAVFRHPQHCWAVEWGSLLQQCSDSYYNIGLRWYHLIDVQLPVATLC